MDIRSYFKGDDTTPPKPPPPPPKSPPRPAILELPDFLFISAASGVKRSRSTVAENVDDIDKSDHFNSNLHRVLSPLEVRVMPPTTKPANEITPTNNTKRKKSKSNKNDGFYFSDDMDDRLAMFAAHKEKLKKDKEEETNKKKKPLKSSKEFEKSEQPKTNSYNNNKTSHIPPNNQTTLPATPPPKPPQPVSPIPPLPPVPPIPPKPSPTISCTSPSNPKPKENSASMPSKKVVVDLELEDKIQQKMDVVQLWQNKCSDLRKQLAHATSQLSQSLDELDHLNSLYEESNH